MKTAKLFVVRNEMANSKINTLIFNKETTIEDAIGKYPILNERKIISAEIRDCELIPYGKSGKKFQIPYTDLVVNENGRIIEETSCSNPNDDELMEIINNPQRSNPINQ
jgi:hypothetical protein